MIDSEEYIEELKYSLDKQDKIKVHLVINDFEMIDPESQRMAVDILADNQSELAIEELSKLLGVGSIYLKNHSKERLIGLGSKVVSALINNLGKDDSELVIHTLNVLGDIGDSKAVSSIRKVLKNSPKEPNIRFAAYEALGKIPVKSCAYTLASGLEDSVEDVAIAAAKAIDSNYSSILHSGIRNIFEDKGEDLKRLVEIVIISEAGNMFLSLIDNKIFLELAINYIKEKSCSDIKLYFINILRKNGYESIACKIGDYDKAESVDYSKKEIWCVDDSKMILRIYGKTLKSLDLKSRQFEHPNRVLEELKSKTPALLFTDLNMPDITGIELIKEIRKTHSEKLLPIIMVTTQADIEDSNSLLTLGVTKVIHKPFSKEVLKKAISEFTIGVI